MNDWNECKASFYVLESTPDTNKVKSLISVADERILFLEAHPKQQRFTNYIFEGYYACMLEYLHALVLFNGFKVQNHICLGFYLRDIQKNKRYFTLFDECRYKRNTLLYYGKPMSEEVATQTITYCLQVITYLKKELSLLLN